MTATIALLEYHPVGLTEEGGAEDIRAIVDAETGMAGPIDPP